MAFDVARPGGLRVRVSYGGASSTAAELVIHE